VPAVLEETGLFAGLWSHVPEGFVLLDSESGIIVEANPRAESMLEYRRADLVGKPFTVLFAAGRRRRAAALFVIGTVEPMRSFETQILDGAGRPRDVEISTSGTFLIDGRALVLAIFRDIDNSGRDRKAAAAPPALAEERTRAHQLEAALEGTLEALGATLGKRDPYTAGHQKRVAALCGLIATELALDDDRARGLVLAASVHDIGKIAIPAEILTKPVQLNAMEHALVRTHPEIGYDILHSVPFRWPIAEIVRQHHEYLDGSGYPRGLEGDAILLEARILTVADIAESMSSFRPYHAAHDVAAIVAELASQAGRRLDRDVVAACIRILQRGDFQPHEG